MNQARSASDTIAERMRASGAVPGGRPETVGATMRLAASPAGEISTFNAVDEMTDRLYSAVGTLRQVHDEVDAEDPSTSVLLPSIIDQLEKQAWMLAAENRAV